MALPFPKGGFSVVQYGPDCKGALTDDEIDQTPAGSFASLRSMDANNPSNETIKIGRGAGQGLSVIATSKYLLLHTRNGNLVVLGRATGSIVYMPSGELNETQRMQAYSILIGVTARVNTPFAAVIGGIGSQTSVTPILMCVFVIMGFLTVSYLGTVYINARLADLVAADRNMMQSTADLVGANNNIVQSTENLLKRTMQTEAAVEKLDGELQKTNKMVREVRDDFGKLAKQISKLSVEKATLPSIGAAANKNNEVGVYTGPVKSNWFSLSDMVFYLIVFIISGSFITACMQHSV